MVSLCNTDRQSTRSGRLYEANNTLVSAKVIYCDCFTNMIADPMRLQQDNVPSTIL
jgi:hypothetical protein